VSAHVRRVLVLTAGETDGLPEAIHERVARTRAEVLVVAPASLPDPILCRCVQQLRLAGFDAEGMVGDADPAQAIEDALAVFDADVLVVDGHLADRARRRFGLPIVPVRAAA
jgi:hypothetical protein